MIFYKKGNKLYFYLMHTSVNFKDLTEGKSEKLKKFLDKSLDYVGTCRKAYPDFSELLGEKGLENLHENISETTNNIAGINPYYNNLEIYIRDFMMQKAVVTHNLIKDNPLLVEFADISQFIVYEKVGKFQDAGHLGLKNTNKILFGDSYDIKNSIQIINAWENGIDPCEVGENNHKIHLLMKEYLPQAKFHK